MFNLGDAGPVVWMATLKQVADSADGIEAAAFLSNYHRNV